MLDCQLLARPMLNENMKHLKIINTLILIFSICMNSFGQKGIENYNKGLSLMEQGNYQDAIIAFSEGIKANDIYKSVNYYGRAYSYFEIKNFEKAKMDIESSLLSEKVHKESINSNIYWLKGLVASSEGNKKLEIECYEKAIAFSPENQGLKTTLGLALIEDDQFQKGIELLDNVLKKNSQDAYALCNRALGFIKIRELEKAKSDLDNSKKLDNENPFLHKNYFLYYKEKGEKENACEAIEEALKKKMSDYGGDEDTKELIQMKNEYCA